MEQKELEKMAMHYANTRLGHFTSSCVSWLFSCMRDSDGTQNGAQLDALPQRMWQISGSEDASESHRVGDSFSFVHTLEDGPPAGGDLSAGGSPLSAAGTLSSGDGTLCGVPSVMLPISPNDSTPGGRLVALPSTSSCSVASSAAAEPGSPFSRQVSFAPADGLAFGGAHGRARGGWRPATPFSPGRGLVASPAAKSPVANQRVKLDRAIEDATLRQLRIIAQTILPVSEDAAGFNRFCHHTDIVSASRSTPAPLVLQLAGECVFESHFRQAWLKVSYVRYRAVKGGPFPRRQDLRAGSHIKGAPPAFARKFVVSHAWASEFHPSPTGQTMRFLAAELDRLNADDDDCVFLECVSEASNPVESLCKPFSCALASLSVDQTFESRVWQLLLASAEAARRQRRPER